MERITFRTAGRVQKAIAIDSLIAWRLMVLTLLACQVPTLATDLLFTTQEDSQVTMPGNTDAPDGTTWELFSVDVGRSAWHAGIRVLPHPVLVGLLDCEDRGSKGAAKGR